MTFLSVAELAEQSGRHEKTIRRAITSGRLPADVDEVSGQYRIPTEAAFALYPPRKGGEYESEQLGPTENVDGEVVPVPREPKEPPLGWNEGYADGQLMACRSIVELDCSPELWAALRAILL